MTVQLCEQVQTDWFRTRAELLGEVRTDGPLTWLRGPDEISLMFPETLPVASLARGSRWASSLGLSIGAWLDRETDPGPLADAGFEQGWEPWWMVAGLDSVAEPDDPRVVLQESTTDYGGDYARYADLLALARLRPKRSWYAAARTTDGQFAGHAWAHRVGAVAGIFDMAVWPPFQRTGLGSALLRSVCVAARDVGATRAVLNATPEGKLLYSRHGFRQVGTGITWWYHPRST